MIYIPKYKDLYIKDGHMGVRSRIKGEYRAYLYDSAGALKYDSGWKPNTVLNQGFSYMCTNSVYGLFRGGMALGDGSTPVDVTQTGLQGNLISSSNNWASSSTGNVSAINGGAPNYESIDTRSYTYNAGVATGTIREFVFVGKQFNEPPYDYTGDPVNEATIRVVLDATIIKGASDVLTIEHRTTHYPEINDVTGVIDISGVAYNYLLRGIDIDAKTARPNNCEWHGWAIRPGSTDNMTPNTGLGPSVTNDYGSCWNSYSPSGITSFTEGHITAGVDKWNIDLRCFTHFNSGMGHSYQIRLGKVSDDSPFTKENTHQLTLGIRMYPTRYVP